ncbi:MAG TPA: GTPase Era [Stellaceae bacterium]
MSAPEATRCGYVALVGAPNSGKSTLLNQLIGAKVSIVSPKVQTTRSRVLGIIVEGTAQLVFIDTPGIFQPKRRLERAMVAAAWAGTEDADVVVVLTDASRGGDGDTERIVAGLKAAGRRALLALNKVDLVSPPQLLPLAERLSKAGIFDRVFMISGLTGDGVGDLRKHLGAALPQGPWLYPEDQLTDLPQRLLAAETTREQIFLQLHQELPYAAMVETDSWEERPDGSVRIAQTVHVQRDSQKAIVLGKGGRQIKDIGAKARAELERVLGRRVHLFLFVRVTEGWTEDRERYAAMGLDFES